MKFRKTNRISLRSYTTLKNAPLGTLELIQRQVNRESEEAYTEQPTLVLEAPDVFGSQLKESPGLLNFFKCNVQGFFLAFLP